MKKLLFTLATSLFLAQATLPAKDATLQTAQVSFIISQTTASVQAASAQDSDFKYCIDMFKYFSDLQKKRKLTLEEMMMVLQVALFLFNDSNEDPSKRIEISVNGKDRLVVPYSSQIFALINQQPVEQNQPTTQQ